MFINTRSRKFCFVSALNLACSHWSPARACERPQLLMHARALIADMVDLEQRYDFFHTQTQFGAIILYIMIKGNIRYICSTEAKEQRDELEEIRKTLVFKSGS